MCVYELGCLLHKKLSISHSSLQHTNDDLAMLSTITHHYLKWSGGLFIAEEGRPVPVAANAWLHAARDEDLQAEMALAAENKWQLEALKSRRHLFLVPRLLAKLRPAVRPAETPYVRRHLPAAPRESLSMRTGFPSWPEFDDGVMWRTWTIGSISAEQQEEKKRYARWRRMGLRYVIVLLHGLGTPPTIISPAPGRDSADGAGPVEPGLTLPTLCIRDRLKDYLTPPALSTNPYLGIRLAFGGPCSFRQVSALGGKRRRGSVHSKNPTSLQPAPLQPGTSNPSWLGVSLLQSWLGRSLLRCRGSRQAPLKACDGESRQTPLQFLRRGCRQALL
ncbi:unnamed protein product [Pleuronectes platessa]|uniref:Uncharacterized protein n=1 Tax=Pleuronectes platessa TaxID=8262 RepID=A0A9N7VSD2_PLEPL|nr:unnamed protein product [Pleuronectes platessa]